MVGVGVPAGLRVSHVAPVGHVGLVVRIEAPQRDGPAALGALADMAREERGLAMAIAGLVVLA